MGKNLSFKQKPLFSIAPSWNHQPCLASRWSSNDGTNTWATAASQLLWHTSLRQKNGLCVKLFNKTTGFEPTKHPVLHQLDKHRKKALFEKNKQLESLILLVSIHFPSPFISIHQVTARSCPRTPGNGEMDAKLCRSNESTVQPKCRPDPSRPVLWRTHGIFGC